VALRERVKRKHIESAIKVLPADGARPIDYALGGGGSMSPRMLVLALVGGWVVVTVLLSVALHTLVVIGAIPLVIVSFALNQPRGVLLSDRGSPCCDAVSSPADRRRWSASTVRRHSAGR
jgi:hypothetical protein